MRFLVDFLSAKRWPFVSGLILIGSSASYAQDTWRGPTNESWFTSENWTQGIPTSRENALVDNGTTVKIPVPPPETSFATAASLTIGTTTAGSTVQLTGGNLGALNNPVSVTIGSKGTFEFSGGFHFGSMVDNGTILFDTVTSQVLSGVSGSGRIIINGIALTLNAENTFNV